MSQQYPGGPADGPGQQPGPGSTPPNPFSREAAGADAGLGSTPRSSTSPDDPAAPEPPASEPSGIVGTPGGPPAGPFTSPMPEAPYAPPAGSATPADPYQASSPPPFQQADAAQAGNPYETPPPAAYPPNPYAGGYGYGAMPYPVVAPQHPQSTVALVLGILGLVVCPPVGIAGFVIGSRVRREIDADPMRYSGRSMATAGWVLGIIAIVYSSLILLYIVVAVIAIAADPSLT